MPPLFSGPEVFSSASDKTKLLAKNFSKNSNFDDSDISLPVFPFRTNLFFFYLGFLSRIFMNHRTAGEGGGHFFNSS